jgi:protein TonB
MSLAPNLVIIEGGLTAEEPPVIPPARDADRIYLPATPTRPGDFAHFVAVSLTLHAAIVAGCIAWNFFGEERASGGTEELVVIEGVNVVMLDQLESTPSPLAEAEEIETSDEATPVEETELAAIARAEMAPPAEDIAETPPEAAAEARPPVEARVVPDEAVEPAPAAKAEAATPVAEDEPAAEAEDLAVAADETATPVKESTIAAAEDLSTYQAAPSVEDRVAAALPEEERPKPIPDAAAKQDEPATPAEAPATEVASDDASEPKPLVEDPIKSAPPEAKVAEAPESVVKPVEETRKAVVVPAPEPAPAAEALPAKVEPPSPPKKVEAKKKQVASAAKPSAAASQATPAAKGPTKAKEKAGAGGKSKQTQGKANVSSYRAKIFAHLRRYQSYPVAARAKRLTGGARVHLTIGSGGRLLGASLVSSSGHAILDKEALAIVRRAAPYPPIPPGMSASVVILAPIGFRIPN